MPDTERRENLNAVSRMLPEREYPRMRTRLERRRAIHLALTLKAAP